MQDRGYLQRLARSIAAARRIDPDLFVRLIDQESKWDPSARSEVGALGLAQVMPDSARSPGYGIKPLRDRLDPVESLRFGADYLAAMLKKYDGDVAKALAAYNFGPGNVDKGRKYPKETRNYIAKIMQTGDSDEERVEALDELMDRTKAKRRTRQKAGLAQILSSLASPQVEQPQVDYRSTMGRRGSGSEALGRLGVASLYDFR